MASNYINIIEFNLYFDLYWIFCERREQGFVNTTRILLSETGTMERDLTDAPKLSPAGLARRYLSFYSLDGQG